MPISQYLDSIMIASVVSGTLSIFYLLTLLVSFKKFRLILSLKKLIGLIFFTSVTGFFSLLIFTSKSYQALTHESHIADLEIIKTGDITFRALLHFSNGSVKEFDLAGDQVMIESNILKWKPWANIFGLKTAYRLDRIRGRYQDIETEKLSTPRLFSLRDESNIDIAEWRKEYQQLQYLVDVEHGSASYVPADKNQTYQLMVTTNGLILRPLAPSS